MPMRVEPSGAYSDETATERIVSGLHPGEPIFVFRAQDVLMPKMLRAYRNEVVAAGSFDRERLTQLDEDIKAAEAWAFSHPDLVKFPD